MASSQWFKDGLRFKCTECGRCCTGSPGYVLVSEEEIQMMAEELGIPVDLFMRRYLRFKDNKYALIEGKRPPYDCIFLQKKRCSIYKARPKQCRSYPWWPQNLKSKESWDRVAQDCEGIQNDAPLISCEEIVKKLG